MAKVSAVSGRMAGRAGGDTQQQPRRFAGRRAGGHGEDAGADRQQQQHRLTETYRSDHDPSLMQHQQHANDPPNAVRRDQTADRG